MRRLIASWIYMATCLSGLAMSSCGYACWEEVGRRYNINPYLLAAIAKKESNFNANAVRQNTNGTRDIGVMQINSIHLPDLAKYGILESHLYDPCTNITVGAWLLSRRQAEYGNTWEAVGTYHSKTKSLKWKYAEEVQANLQQLLPR